MRFGWPAWDFWDFCGLGQTDSPVLGSFDGKMREALLLCCWESCSAMHVKGEKVQLEEKGKPKILLPQHRGQPSGRKCVWQVTKIVWSYGLFALCEQCLRYALCAESWGLWVHSCEGWNGKKKQKFACASGGFSIKLCRPSLVEPGDLQKAFQRPQKCGPAKCCVLLWTPEEAWKFTLSKLTCFYACGVSGIGGFLFNT